MADHFRQAQTELECMGYEFVSRNTRSGETWTHGCGHSLVIYPGMKEHAHRSILRDCQKALGIKQQTNKRDVAKVKERQAKDRERQRQEMQARAAWVEARIRDLEMAGQMRALTAQQRQLLNERMAELAELRRLMSQVPTYT